MRHLPFYPSNHVAIQKASFQYAKSGGAPSFYHAPTVWEHLYASNIEDGTIVDWRTACFGGHYHAEERIRRFETATKHETISEGEKVESQRGKEREREIGMDLGSKKWRTVGTPGKLSWHTKIGVFRRA